MPLKDPEKRREYKKKYYERNKEEIKQRQKKYRETRREEEMKKLLTEEEMFRIFDLNKSGYEVKNIAKKMKKHYATVWNVVTLLHDKHRKAYEKWKKMQESEQTYIILNDTPAEKEKICKITDEKINEVFDLILMGKTVKEITMESGVNGRSIENIRHRIYPRYRKLFAEWQSQWELPEGVTEFPGFPNSKINNGKQPQKPIINKSVKKKSLFKKIIESIIETLMKWI